MGCRLAGRLLLAWVIAFETAQAGSIPPGRQHRLTIEGENTVTFVPQANRPDVKVDYLARIEYLVDSRYGKEPNLAASEAKAKSPEEDEADATDKPTQATVTTNPKKTNPKKTKKADNPSSRATGAIDLSLHSSERTIRQNGQPVVEMKVGRSKFQGRLNPEMPIVTVGPIDAPFPLQEIMKGFDVIAASLLLNDDLKVVNRKYRSEGPQRAITETILSIHAPIPRNADSWEAPTQLAMGQGQTAKGTLRFVKEKPAVVVAPKDQDKDKANERPLVRVKVAGVLKAEGVVAGQLIKNGTYTVNGEQTFDPKSHEWVFSKWSVVVDNELANPTGQLVARARGTMTVSSKTMDGPNSNPGSGSSSGPGSTERTVPKP